MPKTDDLSPAQIGALRMVQQWSKHGVYMPYADQMRPFEACERRGMLVYRSVADGSSHNGYALTPKGVAALAHTEEIPQP